MAAEANWQSPHRHRHPQPFCGRSTGPAQSIRVVRQPSPARTRVPGIASPDPGGLFQLGLSLQAAIDLPAGMVGQRIEEALGYLDDTIREIRHTAFHHPRPDSTLPLTAGKGSGLPHCHGDASTVGQRAEPTLGRAGGSARSGSGVGDAAVAGGRGAVLLLQDVATRRGIERRVLGAAEASAGAASCHRCGPAARQCSPATSCPALSRTGPASRGDRAGCSVRARKVAFGFDGGLTMEATCPLVESRNRTLPPSS